MSKARNRRPASDTRPARRSMVELTAEASRAVDEALLALPVRLIVDATDHPPRLEPAPERPDQTDAPQQATAAPIEPVRAEPVRTAPVQAKPVQATPVQATPVQVTPVQVTPLQVKPGRPAAPDRPTPRGSDGASADSAAEMVVQIAREYQNSVLDHIKAGLNAALDHARDFAETQPADEKTGPAGRDNGFINSLGAAAAEFRAESLELMQANLSTAFTYVQQMAEARTAAEVVELSGTQARKGCELMLKQADALKSLARSVAKERSGGG